MSDRFLTTVRLKMLKLTVAGGNDSEKAHFPKVALYRWEKKVTHLVYMDEKKISGLSHNPLLQ